MLVIRKPRLLRRSSTSTADTSASRSAWTRLATPTLLTVFLALATTSSATAAPTNLSMNTEVDPSLISALTKAYGITTAEAEQRVLLQQDGAILNDALKENLGERYAGVWYNPSTNRMAVGVAQQTSASQDETATTAAAILSSGLATNEVEEVPVRSTWAELQRAQESINASQAQLLRNNALTTAISASKNTVVLDISSTAPSSTKELVASTTIDVPNVNVTVEQVPQRQMEISPMWCFTKEGGYDPHCNQPARGGTVITGVHEKWLCSAGLLAQQGEKYYMMTAGHCVVDEGGSNVPWEMYEYNWVPKELGDSGGFVFGEDYPNPGGTRDSGAIEIKPSSYWHEYLNAYAYAGSFTSNYPTEGVAEPYEHLSFCHLGISTPNNGSGTNCGEVVNLDASVKYSEGNTVNDMVETTACSHHGDSGGPMYANYVAYGTLSGGDECGQDGGFGSGISYYDAAGNIEYEDGVTLCRLSKC